MSKEMKGLIMGKTKFIGFYFYGPTGKLIEIIKFPAKLNYRKHHELHSI